MYNKDNTREADEIFSRILSEMERQGRKYAELTEYLELPRGTFSSWKAGRSRNFCEHIGAGFFFRFPDLRRALGTFQHRLQDRQIAVKIQNDLLSRDRSRCVRVTSHLSVLRRLRSPLLVYLMVASLIAFSTACRRSALTNI